LLTISENLKELYPDAKFGMLVMKNVKNLHTDPRFSEIKASVQNELLNKYPDFNRKEFVKTEPICFYKNYYKKFKKTYPVQLELESVVLKGKSIPNVSTLVEAMFTAELKNLLLTAGHDLDKINFPLTLSLADGSENFTGISCKDQSLAKNDMMLSDETSVISSILSGPDYRTRITDNTKNALFYTYIPSGISDDAILRHLKDISNYISIFSHDAKVDLIKIF